MNNMVKVSALLAAVCTIAPSFGMLALLNSDKNNPFLDRARNFIDKVDREQAYEIPRLSHDNSSQSARNSLKSSDVSQQLPEELILKIACSDPSAYKQIAQTNLNFRGKLKRTRVKIAKKYNNKPVGALSYTSLSYCVAMDDKDQFKELIDSAQDHYLKVEMVDGKLTLLSVKTPIDLSELGLVNNKREKKLPTPRPTNNYPPEYIMHQFDKEKDKDSRCFIFLKGWHDYKSSIDNGIIREKKLISDNIIARDKRDRNYMTVRSIISDTFFYIEMPVMAGIALGYVFSRIF